MKKLTLDVDYQSEYETIGISSHLKDYKLSWHINKKLDFKLKRVEDFKYNAGKKNTESSFFSIYYYKENTNYLTFYLISNHSNKGIFLIPEQKIADYFLFISGLITEQQKQTLIKNIKSIANVLTVFTMDMTKMKDINNILSDLELHTSKPLK